MEPTLESVIEALFFASGQPLGIRDLTAIFKECDAELKPTKKEIEEAIASRMRHWEEKGGGIRLVAVAEGYEFRTEPSYAPWIRRLQRSKPQRLSVPAVESLAMIAYRQPITRAEIEELRGVDCGGVLKSLVDRKLIKVVGRKEEAGRPLLYATTPEFLELFGLKDLNDLPPLNEFEEMLKAQESTESDQDKEETLAVDDLISSPEELVEMADDDKAALEELDEKLKNLKTTEKAVILTMPTEEAGETPPENQST